jgi:replication-associated recombination protein RarA
LSVVEKKIEYPRKVEDKDMQHVIVYGYPGSGKTAMCEHIAKEHKRCLVTLD